ncbi:hypothetical protein, partial [Nocardia vulneris]|uniref:hypothetical protein n=1 Tax=Nocardia vulneris TaxID=1141657 RepID=UPI001AE06C59
GRLGKAVDSVAPGVTAAVRRVRLALAARGWVGVGCGVLVQRRKRFRELRARFIVLPSGEIG